jgi:DNA-binding transcriptional LysR family regulator
METAQVEAFLALAEELHFGRTAQRLHISRPRVSQLVAALERQAGGRLFERTSRRVALTPLGQQLDAGLRPAYEQMTAALQAARAAARVVTGVLRVGCAYTVSGPELTRLTEEFSARYRDCELVLHTVEGSDPYGPLRRGEVDVLVFYQAVDEPDLTAGPVIGYRDRVLAVGRGHRLATRESVCVEDLGDEETQEKPPEFPAALYDAHRPARTPSGRPIRRTYPWRGAEDQLTAVARGRIVLPAVRGPALLGRSDLVLVPIRDLPPMPLGLIWCTAHENGRIRALAATARAIYRLASLTVAVSDRPLIAFREPAHSRSWRR